MFGAGLLSGKKTYIVGIILIINSIAAYLVGGSAELGNTAGDLQGAIDGALTGLGLITLRSGVKKIE